MSRDIGDSSVDLVGDPGRGKGVGGGVPCRAGGDAAGGPLVGSVVVVGLVEGIDVDLEFGQCAGQWSFVEVAEQGLIARRTLGSTGSLAVGTASNSNPNCRLQPHQFRHRCPDKELSPMS